MFLHQPLLKFLVQSSLLLFVLLILPSCGGNKPAPAASQTPSKSSNVDENLTPPTGALVVAVHTKDRPFIDWS